jgi:hypothetical protein
VTTRSLKSLAGEARAILADRKVFHCVKNGTPQIGHDDFGPCIVCGMPFTTCPTDFYYESFYKDRDWIPSEEDGIACADLEAYAAK